MELFVWPALRQDASDLEVLIWKCCHLLWLQGGHLVGGYRQKGSALCILRREWKEVRQWHRKCQRMGGTETQVEEQMG